MNKTDLIQLAKACQKLDDICESLREIKEHLKTLNGQVADNTKFKSRATVILAIVSAVSMAILVYLLPKIFGG